MGLTMAKKEQTIRFTVSLPEKLLAELDRRVAGKGYTSRSECVRDLIREEKIEEAWRDSRKDASVFPSLAAGAPFRSTRAR